MTEDAFFSALHESPSDEVTWLALADWLDENGQSERAELVRLVRQLRQVALRPRRKQRSTLEDRVAQLLRDGVRPAIPEVQNSLGMRLALIPPGQFLKGSPKTERDRFLDENANIEQVEKAFYLGVFAVTQQQYSDIMGRNPSWFCRDGGGHLLVAGLETSDFPVEQVSWNDAMDFCQRLSKREGQHYRLPTEAEWEYACRGGSASTTPFYLGSTLTSTQANFDGNHPYFAEPGPNLTRTSRVGSYLPNVFGLYDMHGNVWEWCADMAEEAEDFDESEPQRRFRGGCWHQYGRGCRSAFRSYDDPRLRADSVGFRVTLSHKESQ